MSKSVFNNMDYRLHNVSNENFHKLIKNFPTGHYAETGSGTKWFELKIDNVLTVTWFLG